MHLKINAGFYRKNETPLILDVSQTMKPPTFETPIKYEHSRLRFETFFIMDGWMVGWMNECLDE